ncbi:helix-turn-helix domain-containing protein [Chitinophaga vietnamensis]|uniref:helix-turn-helix domain-containing protein n=1 Tax=Chitinophaga vietnamensis TaxID=2593957 RepID=UPI001F1A5904|nr:helix-turn-helix domain-containing protein [Chitinophaga vietnamensis]
MPVKPDIPQFVLTNFRQEHRQENDSSHFGYSNLPDSKKIKGFEIYSSEGVKPALGPLKSLFYRMSFSVKGSVDVQIGLEEFSCRPGSVAFTFPGQVFSKRNISADAFGYYILFDKDFMEEVMPADRLVQEFPFFDYSGMPHVVLPLEVVAATEDLLKKMNEEVQEMRTGREKAIKMYLYLLLLGVKRCYDTQQPATNGNDYLVARFRKLVSQHFLTKRKVSDYAELLNVTANHLNRTVKNSTGNTASAAISEMLLREAKAVLKYTDASVSEVSYQLDFSDPAAFSRFFREQTGITPMAFRRNA